MLRSGTLSKREIKKMISFWSRRGFGYINSAARLGFSDLICLLLSHGAVPDDPKPFGCTALHESILHRRKDCVRELTLYGANLDAAPVTVSIFPTTTVMFAI